MKWKRLERNVYPVTVYFCQGGTVKEIVKKLKRLKLTPLADIETHEAQGIQLGWTLKMRDRQNCFAVLIWVTSCKRTPKDVSIFTHECYHCLNYTMEYISNPIPCFEDQELGAYYLDYLVQQGLDFFWKP